MFLVSAVNAEGWSEIQLVDVNEAAELPLWKSVLLASRFFSVKIKENSIAELNSKNTTKYYVYKLTDGRLISLEP